MTISLIGATEAAVRDGSGALQLNMLRHAHVLAKPERGKGSNGGRVLKEDSVTHIMTR